jgi:hypothetical protein
VGTVTVIVVLLLPTVIEVVALAPNCTLVTEAKPVPVMTTDVEPARPVATDKDVILGAAPASPGVVVTGAKTWVQLPTPMPVGAEGTVPAGHVVVCLITSTYAVKKIVVAVDDLAVKAASAALVAITLQLPEMPAPKFAVSTEPDREQAAGWLAAKT